MNPKVLLPQAVSPMLEQVAFAGLSAFVCDALSAKFSGLLQSRHASRKDNMKTKRFITYKGTQKINSADMPIAIFCVILESLKDTYEKIRDLYTITASSGMQRFCTA